MKKEKTSDIFIQAEGKSWEAAGEGVSRQIMGYGPSLMLVRVKFETGAEFGKHTHAHVQSTYVLSGKFEVEVNGKKKLLSAGDCYYVPSDVIHSTQCIEGGILLDAFSPCREDFLSK